MHLGFLQIIQLLLIIVPIRPFFSLASDVFVLVYLFLYLMQSLTPSIFAAHAVPFILSCFPLIRRVPMLRIFMP